MPYYSWLFENLVLIRQLDYGRSVYNGFPAIPPSAFALPGILREGNLEPPLMFAPHNDPSSNYKTLAPADPSP